MYLATSSTHSAHRLQKKVLECPILNWNLCINVSVLKTVAFFEDFAHEVVLRSSFAGWLISTYHFGQDGLEYDLVTEAWFPSPIPLLKAYVKACLLMFNLWVG